MLTRAHACRSRRADEFFAHDAPINCASLSRHSAILLATGAEDCRVHIWNILRQKQKPIKTLLGHSKPIRSVQFDRTDEGLAAGSESGTVRIWDLRTDKVTATMAEHRSSVGCLDFYPLGKLITTGSADTNIKIWDPRKRNSMMTLKGHNSALTSIRHSPDGLWAIAGDLGGCLKIWDLQTRKTVKEWKLGGGVTSIDFHPTEMTMAVSTEQKTVTFFDLEALSKISQTSINSTKIRNIIFHKDGAGLLSAGTDGLKSWVWEPEAKMKDFVDARWNDVADLSLASSGELLYGVSIFKNQITTTAVNISQMAPFGTPPAKTDAKVTAAPAPSTKVSSEAETPRQSVEAKKTTHISRPRDMTLSHNPAATLVPTQSDKPIGLSLSGFLPAQEEVDEGKVRGEIKDKHVKFRVVLTQRLHRLRLLRTLWQKGDVKGAVAALVKMGVNSVGDSSVAADFLKHAEKSMKSALTLDMAADLLPTITTMLNTRIETFIATGLRYAEYLLKGFSPVITSTLAVRPGAGPVNPSFEARRERCDAVYQLFVAMKPKLRNLLKKDGRVGRDAAKVLKLTEALN